MSSVGARAGYVDLHMHSTASDGSLSPTAVVEAARVAGLVAIALTDHDTVAGVGDARRAGAAAGIEVVPGVELSAHDGKQEVHMLGLHLGHVEALAGPLTEFRNGRTTRAERMVERLRSLGATVTMDDVLREASGGAVGRPHVARALVARGFVSTLPEAFERYLAAGRPAYIGKDRLSIPDAIRMVHDAGGLAVLAHPGQHGTREALEAFRKAGGDGVEVRHPGHTAADIARIERLAGEIGLVPSGGSDWHGLTSGDRVLGAMRVPFAWLELQRARVAERVARAHVA